MVADLVLPLGFSCSNQKASLSTWVARGALAWLDAPADEWGKPITESGRYEVTSSAPPRDVPTMPAELWQRRKSRARRDKAVGSVVRHEPKLQRSQPMDRKTV